MRVAINGIGVAGPALAYWLKRFGHEPVLFERAPTLRTGGYLVDFWGLGFDLAERIGIIPTLMARGYLMRQLRLVDEAGHDIANLDVEPMRAHLKGRFVSVARSDVSSALFQACLPTVAHFGVSVVAIGEEKGGVRVVLSNGRTDRFDLVVGADGLHSAVRTLAFLPKPRFERSLDCYVAAFRLPAYPHRDELAYVSHTVPQRQVARVTLRNGETLILLICRSALIGADPPANQRKAALRQAFGGMKWEVPEILSHLEGADDLYFDRVSQIHLDSWCSGRVALVGDAGACVSFLAGEGTGLAIIEAYVLAGELHRAMGDLAKAFAAYQRRLARFVRQKQRAAFRFRGFFAPKTTGTVAVRNAVMRFLAVPFMTRHVFPLAFADRLELPEYERG